MMQTICLPTGKVAADKLAAGKLACKWWCSSAGAAVAVEIEIGAKVGPTAGND